jgi:photosystem II stability/assembly factor-like uncharacterized protein
MSRIRCSSLARRAPALVFIFVLASIYAEARSGLLSPISLIQADPHIEGTLLAGTVGGRLFRSRDGGDNWSPLFFPPQQRSTLHAIRIDSQKPGVYWAAVSSETTDLGGIFRSADEGATWQQVVGMRGKQVWALVFWKGDTNVIAAGTEEGTYVSRDGGGTWTLQSELGSSSPHPVVSLAFDPADVNTLYAGTPHLAWKTVDGGATWRPIHRGMQEDSDIFSFDVDVNRRTRLLVGACSGIYRSLDGGSSWTNLERTLGGQYRTYVVTRAPDRPGVVYAGTSDGLMVSRDSGTTWKRLSPTAARSVAFDIKDSSRVFIATDEGVLLIDDPAARTAASVRVPR